MHNLKQAPLSGLLFYTERSNENAKEERGDFVAVGLRGGKIVYRYDLGSGPAEIVSNYPIKVGEWHRIKFTKDDSTGMYHTMVTLIVYNLGTLVVNDEDVGSVKAPGTQIGLGQADSVFLGGVDNYSSINSERVGFDRGFDGIYLSDGLWTSDFRYHK